MSTNISCNNANINSKTSVTYLCVTVGQYMSGIAMGSAMFGKINTKAKFLYRKGRLVNSKLRQILASAY